MEIRIILDNGSYSDVSEWYNVDNAVGVAKFASELLKWVMKNLRRGRRFSETSPVIFQTRKSPNPKRTLF